MITDFLFPQADALDLIVPLRQIKSATELPIITVSGAMDTALANRLLKTGVNACVCKPFKPDEFLTLVERMLQAPFIESYKNTVSTVNCFQWFQHGAYHEYCPELKKHLTGPDRNEVSMRMNALLHEHAGKGEPLGFTIQERVRAYLVQPGLAVPVECSAEPVI